MTTRSTFTATIGDEGTYLATRLRDDRGYQDLTDMDVIVRATHRLTGQQWTAEQGGVPDGDQVNNKGLVRVVLTDTDLAPATRTPGEYDLEWEVTGDAFTGTFPSRDPVTGHRDTLILEPQDG